MNKSKAIKIAIAFKRGAAFIRGMRQLAQDADVPEGARWITIGAAEGDDGKRHGGRNVLIDKESGTILKGLSKDVQGKTLKDAFKELKSDTYEVTPGSGVTWKKPKSANKAQTAEIKKAKDAYISLSEGTAADLEPYVAELKKLRKVVRGTPDAAILENRIKELTRNVQDLSLNAGEDLAKITAAASAFNVDQFIVFFGQIFTGLKAQILHVAGKFFYAVLKYSRIRCSFYHFAQFLKLSYIWLQVRGSAFR